MNTRYKLLSLAVATALLSACGGSSGSDTKPAPTKPTPTKPTPTQPSQPEPKPPQPEPPAPVVLNDEQRLQLGKELLKRIDSQASDLVAGGAKLAKQILAMGDQNKVTVEGEEEARILIFLALQNVLNALNEVEDEVERLMEKVRDNSISYNTAIALPDNTNRGALRYQGTTTVNKTGNQLSFSFDWNLEVKTGNEADALPGKMVFTLTREQQEFTPENDDDPANWQDKLTLSGSFKDTSSNTEFLITDFDIERIFVLSADNLAKAKVLDKYEYQAAKHAGLTVKNISAKQPGMEVSAAASIELVKPLVKLDNDKFGYKATYGSISALSRNRELRGPLSLLNDLPTLATRLTGILVESSFQNAHNSLNLRRLAVTDVKVKIGGAASESSAQLSELIFDDVDALMYESDLLLSQSSSGYNNPEQDLIQPVAKYQFSADKNTLTLTNQFGSAEYKLIQSNLEGGLSKVICTPTSKSPITTRLVGFHEPYSYRCDINRKQSTPSNSLKEWLAEPHINSPLSIELPGYHNVEIKNTDALTSSDAALAGDLMARGSLRISSDRVDLPLTYQYTLDASFKLNDMENQTFTANIKHPGSMDYRLSAQLGEAEKSLKIDIATLDLTTTLSSQVKVQHQLFNAKAVIELPQVQKLVQQAEFSKVNEAQLKVAPGIVENKVGQLTVDGKDVADVLLYRGNIIDQEAKSSDNMARQISGPDSGPKGIALGIRFIDGNNKALFDDTKLFKNVAKFSFTEQCTDPGDTPDNKGSNCTKTYYPQTGVIYQPRTTLKAILEQNLAPYKLNDLPLFGE